jgi:tRNA(Arg) A34 adenosine deaminase TadA
MHFSKKDKEIMNIALEQAKKALKNGNYPIGAVLTINKKLVGVGKKFKIY